MATNSKVLVVPPATPGTSNAAPASLHDIKPPVKIPDYWIYFWIGAAIVALAMAVYWLKRYRAKKRSAETPPPLIPPENRARQKLQEALELIDQPGPFTVLVSDAVRHYLEERFRFHAPDRTTEEFLTELQSTPRLSGEQKLSLSHFLEKCDLVKFARYEPMRAELMELHGAASRLVEETIPTPNESTTRQPAHK